MIKYLFRETGFSYPIGMVLLCGLSFAWAGYPGKCLAGPTSGVFASRTQVKENGDAPPASDQAENEKQQPAKNGEGGQGLTDDENAKASDSAFVSGYLVRIPMPVNGSVAERAIADMQRVLDRLGPVEEGVRPIMVVELDNRNGTNGIGSSFEDCQKIARFLTSSKMNRVRTVCYLPGLTDVAADLFDDGQQPKATFQSHVVLIALSCEEIAMHKDAMIGNAGVELDTVDEVYRTVYRVMAENRRVFPPLVALSMLDRSLVVYRVDLRNEGIKYVEEAEFQKLNSEGKVLESITIAGPNSFGMFSSDDLLSYRLIRHRVDSRKDLAERYNLSPHALEGDPSLGEKWNPIRISISGVLSGRMVNWIDNALSSRVHPDKVNLIIVDLESAGGEPDAAFRLAQRLAEYDPMKIRTVAYVSGRARGVASIVALGCDHLVMHEDAVLGGENRPPLKPEQLGPIKESLKELAKKKEVNWSLYYGLLDPAFEVKRFKHKRTGRMVVMSDEEKDLSREPDQWQEVQLVDLTNGLDGQSADGLNMVRALVEDFEEFKSFYQLVEDPRTLEPTLADRWVEQFAHQLASPRIAWLVLFGAIFFLSMEMSSPGLGVPGFLSALCWMLFFWSQYFDGNASVLEILLFLGGVVFILIEFFVIPGFGIFGVGGALMVAVSLVLAVQTFTLPANPEEMRTFRTSLLTLTGASSGLLVAAFLFRRYAQQIPLFRRLMLDPKETYGDEFATENREALVDYDFLEGKSGVTQTSLRPSGRALIDNELYNVITDGRLIEKGKRVTVRKVTGNRIEVVEADA